MIPGVSCSTCALFSPHPTIPGRGQCRAEPPKLNFQSERVTSIWPVVKAGDFCGSHCTVEVVEVD